MRYAILSDIHSNLEALNAVLDHLASQRIDRYLCLGDMVGYGADPEACLSRLQACEAQGVCGNHDWACAGKFDLQWFHDVARQAILWTRDRLSVTDLDWLRGLPLVRAEDSVTWVHGTLRHPERFDYLVELAQGVDTAKSCQTPFCLVGHTHVPIVLEYDLRHQRVSRLLTLPSELATVNVVIDDPGRFRYVMNPGSVGQPRDGDPRASVGILDTQAGTFSVHRLGYEIAVAQDKIRRANLPELLAERLALGR